MAVKVRDIFLREKKIHARTQSNEISESGNNNNNNNKVENLIFKQ